MKKLILIILTLSISTAFAQAQWNAVGEKIKTQWAAQVDPNNPLPEYPRPLMQRKDWKSLNGLWEYAIQSKDAPQKPEKFEGKILVPFAVESSLSGVMKTLGKDDVLVYERKFTIPQEWDNKQIILHFGAVDWHAKYG